MADKKLIWSKTISNLAKFNRVLLYMWIFGHSTELQSVWDGPVVRKWSRKLNEKRPPPSSKEFNHTISENNGLWAKFFFAVFAFPSLKHILLNYPTNTYKFYLNFLWKLVKLGDIYIYMYMHKKSAYHDRESSCCYSLHKNSVIATPAFAFMVRMQLSSYSL